eukprot:554889-Hanusia_phi.AAC.15
MQSLCLAGQSMVAPPNKTTGFKYPPNDSKGVTVANARPVGQELDGCTCFHSNVNMLRLHISLVPWNPGIEPTALGHSELEGLSPPKVNW